MLGEGLISLFSSEPELIKNAVEVIPKFGWGFLLASLNLMVGTYLYSTKRTQEAAILSICRCIVINSISILILPHIAGAEIVWHTTGIAELVSFSVAVVLVKNSEINGVIFR
jgi:Na+-driven multidrug efflux pump